MSVKHLSEWSVKRFAALVIVLGAIFAGLQWLQIGYRVRLFHQYGGEKYMNHVGDDFFIIIHLANLLLLLAGAVVISKYWRGLGTRRWFAIAIITVNVSAWGTFCYMHSTGMLVGYMEFIRHMKGS